MPATHSFDAFSRALNKGDLAAGYYFYGPEDVLKEEAVRFLVDRALDPGMRDFNLDQVSAGQLDPEGVHALCNTLPMMGERRVVVVRELEALKRKTKARAELLKYLEAPSPHTLVVLVQGSGDEAEDKELARSAFSVRFDPLSPERAAKWVMRRANELGFELESEAADHLVRSVGAELAALTSELAKLASLPAGMPHTVERIAELVGIRQGETQWDWRTAVLEDRTGPAVSLLPAILAQPGVSGVKLVTALGTALLGLALTRSLYDGGMQGRGLEEAVVKTLFRNRPQGLLGYRDEAALWVRIAPRWPPRRIRGALQAALDADQALKSTTLSDERGVLTDLIFRIGAGEHGEGGKSEPATARSRMQVAARALFIASAFTAVSALSALSAQTDPRLVEAIRQAQEGHGDSARLKVQRLLASTSPGDTLYPQIVYTQAMVANEAADMRRQLQRVAVEYSSSSWADDALLRLVQLDYASGNLDGAARNLERIRLDYPGSSLLPQASYWAARTYFDQKRPEQACRWISDGMAAARDNVELRNQLGYLNQRCTQFAAAGPPRDTQSAPTPPRDTAQITGALPPDSGVPLDPTPAPPATSQPPPPHPRAATPQPEPRRTDTIAAAKPQPEPRRTDTLAAARPPDAGTRYRVQITAVRSVATAQSTAAKLKSRGFDVVLVEEGGLYKVRIGSYATKAEAVAALPEIKSKLGGSPFVVTES